MTIVMILFFVVFPVLLIYFAVKYSKLKKTYAEVKEKADKVSDADQYSTSTRYDADVYSREKHTEADSYYEGKHREALDYYQKKVKNADERCTNLEAIIESLNGEKGKLEEDLKDLELKVLVGSVKIDAYENMKSDEIKNKLALLRNRQDELVKSGEALVVTTDAAKRIADSQKRQILRCFNAETENIIQSVTVKNVDTSRAKIQRSFDAINKMFVVDGVQISPTFLESKFEELSLVYAYMVREEEEREQRKAIREQMVEEDKVRREIEKEKQK